MNNLKPFTIYKMKSINYIGSTCDLSKRQIKHNSDCFGQCKNAKVYQHIRQNFLKIELIPLVEIFVGDKARAMIEQVFIDKYDSVENGYNTYKAYQTSSELKLHEKEYNKKNKERVAKRQKEYNEKNKEHIAKQGKRWRDKNKKRIAKRKKEWDEKNKERVAKRNKEYREKNKVKSPCPHCLKVMIKRNITRHVKKSCKAIERK